MTRKILIVDDDTAFSLMLKSRLEASELPALTAQSGAEALQLLKTGAEIDIMLLDIWLPGINGIELLEKVRAGYPEITVFMVSGHGTDETMLKSMKTGAAGYFSKPLNTAELISSLMNSRLKAAEKLEKQPPVKHIKGSVLVADDDPSIRGLLKSVLEEEGFITAVEQDGRKALDRITADSFDIIILDVNMPQLNGIETLKQIKLKNPDIFVVMMTGEASEKEIQEAQHEGSYIILRKPFNMDKLSYQINWLYETKIKRDKEKLLQEEQEKLPYTRKLAGSLKRRISMIRAVNLKRAAGVMIISALLSVVFLTVIYFLSGQISKQTSNVMGIVDDVMGYLQRDEEREIHRPR